MTTPPGPAETPEETQERFLESSLDLVFAAYDEAAEPAGEPTVVLLLDCEDEIGGEIAHRAAKVQHDLTVETR